MAKRKIGHITSVENAKVAQALWMAKNACGKKSGEAREGCMKGLEIVEEELRFAGFLSKLPTGPRSMGNVTHDDISAAGARALRSCKGFEDECKEACREGVKATEQQIRTILKPQKQEIGKIKIIRER